MYNDQLANNAKHVLMTGAAIGVGSQTAQRELDVANQMALLDSSTESLRDSVKVLFDRLYPVLRDVAPQNVGIGTQETPGPSCDLARTIAGQRACVQVIRDMVLEALNRLEI